MIPIRDLPAFSAVSQPTTPPRGDQLYRSCGKWRSITQSQGDGNILRTVKIRKADWIGHTLSRNCLPKQATEGKIQGRVQVAARQRRRCKKLLYDVKEKGAYWKLIEETQDRTVCRTRFGRGCVPVGKTDYKMNKYMKYLFHMFMCYILCLLLDCCRRRIDKKDESETSSAVVVPLYVSK
jgi:hypothetical protein